MKAPTTKKGTTFAVAGQPFKDFQKKFESPLDKPPSLWYNKYVIKGGTQKSQKGIDTMSDTIRKPTQRENFAELLTLAQNAGRDDLVEFVESRLAQLDKRSTAERKPTAKQIENAGIKESILSTLDPEVSYTAADVAKLIDGLTVQRASALLTQLVNDGAVIKTTDKRKNSYILA